MNDKSEKKSKSSILLIVLVIVAFAILVVLFAAKCPIPVPADQTSPAIEAKKAEEPAKIELHPKVEVPVIGDPAVGN